MTDTDLDRLDRIRREVYGDLEDLLTYDEVCVLLKVKRPTLTRMVGDGVFAPMRSGRRRYISKAAVAAHLKDRQREADAEAEEKRAEAEARKALLRPRGVRAGWRPAREFAGWSETESA